MLVSINNIQIMTHSMTAFGRTSLDGKSGHYTCEIRSVNHRYLDLNIRMPEELRQFETKYRQLISERLSRGRIDCFIKKADSLTSLEGVSINEKTANILKSLNQQVSSLMPSVEPIRTIDVLKWPNILDTPDIQESVIENEGKELINDALDRLVVARQSEGDKLKTLIQNRLSDIDEILKKVTALVPGINATYRSKLTEKLEHIKSELDESRIEQEMIIYLQKSDVAEEIDRLKLHIKEVDKTLNSNKPVGRRLDFLMQELNREANTLSSKSHNAELTQLSVDLKVLIEQMREQVQNIE